MNTKIFKNVISWGLVMSMILSLLPVNMFTALAAESTVFTHIGLNFETFYPGSIVSVYVDNNYGVDSGSGGSLGDNKFLLDRDRYTVKYTYNGNEVIGQWFEIPEDAKSTDILTCTITDNETGNYEIRNITIDDSKAEDRYRKNDINGESFSVYYSGEAINRSFGLQGETWPINYYYTFLKDGKPVTEDDVEYSYFGSGSGFKISTLTDELVNQMEGHFYTLTCHYVPTHTYYLNTDRGEASLYYGDSVHNFIVGTPVSGVKAVYNEDTGIVTATVSVNGNEVEGYEVKWYRGTDENEIGNEIKTSSTYDYEKIKEDEGYEIYAKVKIAEQKYSNYVMHDAVWITSNKVEIPTDAWKIMSGKLNPVQPQVNGTVYIQNIMVKKGETEKALPSWNYVKYEYSIDGGELQEISTNSFKIPADAGGKELKVVITGMGLADDSETYIGSVELKAVVYDSAMKETITSAVLHNGEKYAYPGDILTLKVEPEDATYSLEKREGSKVIETVANPTEEDLKILVTEDNIGKQFSFYVKGNGLFYNSSKYSNTVTIISPDTKIYDAKIVNEGTGKDEVAVGEMAKLIVTDQESGAELTLGEDFEVTTWKYYTIGDSGYSESKNIENSADTLQQTLTSDQYTEMCKYGNKYNTSNRLYVSIKGLGNYEYINKSPSIVAIETPSEDKKELTVTLGEAVYNKDTDEYVLDVTVGSEGTSAVENTDYNLSTTLFDADGEIGTLNYENGAYKYKTDVLFPNGIEHRDVFCKITGINDYVAVGTVDSNIITVNKVEQPDTPVKSGQWNRSLVNVDNPDAASVEVGQTVKLLITDSVSDEELKLGEDFAIDYWYYRKKVGESQYEEIKTQNTGLMQEITQEMYDDMTTKAIIVKFRGLGAYSSASPVMADMKVTEKTVAEDKLTVTDSTTGKTDPSSTKPGNTLVAELSREVPSDAIYTWYVENGKEPIMLRQSSENTLEISESLVSKNDLINKKIYCQIISKSEAFSFNSELILVVADTEEANNAECNVIVSQGQSFKVTIPAFVSLDGKKNDLNQNKAQFNTVVVADIAGKDSIEVKPACEGLTFKMEEAGGIKKALDAVIEGDDKGWIYKIGLDDCTEDSLSSDEGVVRTHTITVSNLSAGRWTGTFDWRIVTTGNKIDDSEEYVKYKTYKNESGKMIQEGDEVKVPDDAKETPWE